MAPFWQRFKSRKFILALLGNITAIVVLFFPGSESEIVAASQNIGALLLMALSSIGFIAGESKIDAAREDAKGLNDVAKNGLVLLLAGLLTFTAIGCSGTYKVTVDKQQDEAQDE